ncbi:MAG: lipoate--protein ligase [Mogibacterium sp.]|nr:lipoate--protein ligase [Mogibacterium sp.]
MKNDLAYTTYYETGSTDPHRNLAFEEYILSTRTQGDILILWQNRNSVILGRNQNAYREVNADFVRSNDISVVRRTTGGGAVYHDLGNLNYSFITDAAVQDRVVQERFTAPIVQALQELGLDASASGRNDILVSGRKVSGTAQRILEGRILHHGTLLFDVDPDMIAGALNADPLKMQSHGVASVRSRVGNIRPLLAEDMTMDAFWQYLLSFLLAGGTVLPAELTAADQAAIHSLQSSKYDTWEWNYGRSPAFTVTNRKRFPGGTVETCLQVDGGVIRDAVIYGDFMARAPIDPVTNALTGCPYEEPAVRAALASIPPEDFAVIFGGITAEELLDTIF